MALFLDFGIIVPAGASGNVKARCPNCTPHLRQAKNKNAKDLSVDIAKGMWYCHNCHWTGRIPAEKQERVYHPPVVTLSKLDPKAMDWMKGRGIFEPTLTAMKVSGKLEYMPQVGKEVMCIAFPYYRNNELINVKYRGPEKSFKLSKGAELILWGYDLAAGKSAVVITEGEIDALSAWEAGWCTVAGNGVVSVPNGASFGTNQKLDYLDNSFQCLEQAEKIILATDGDDPGFALKKELIRRLNRERCYEVNYPEGCKDLNEVLMKLGKQSVLDILNSAKPVPVEGILRLSDFEADLDNLYSSGYESGVTTGYYDFDKLLNFSPGQLTVVTGIPNSGKSAFVDQILVRLSSRHGWKVGVCSFENQPYQLHADKLATCYIGSPLARKDPSKKMAMHEFQAAKDFLQDHFFWFKMKDEDLSIDGILDRAKSLVRAHGIHALLIDPYNYIEHKRSAGQSETEYISELLTKIDRFCEDYMVHVFLVAHPRKIDKDRQTKKYEVPTLYDISGSAHFYNKSDNGITVYRDSETNLVTVFVQKVRFFMNGSRGHATFAFDPPTNRYRPENDMSFISEYQYQIQNRMKQFENENEIVDGLPF